jgi:hypothetical protein
MNSEKLSFGKQAMFFAVMLLLVGVVSFGLSEFLCRLFNPLGISYYPETARYLDTLIVEEPIGYRNRPNLWGKFYGVEVRTNSLGLREPEIPLDPPAGEIRILMLGDSFPFGIGVPYEQTLPHLLEEKLNAPGKPGYRYRVINMGVPSYNTEQELYQLETLGPRLHPNIVILPYMVNDIMPKMWVIDKRKSWYVNLAQRSYAASLVAVLIHKLHVSVPEGIGKRAEIQYRPPQFLPVSASGGLQQESRDQYWPEFLDRYTPQNPGWIAVEQSLHGIQALCRTKGWPFVALTIDKGIPNEMVKNVGKREGFPVVLLAPFEDPRWQDQDPARYVNSPLDSHPNAAGNMLYATLIQEQLQQLGVLDALQAGKLRHSSELAASGEGVPERQ